MLVTELNVSGYRSIRQLRLKMGKVNVLTGPNGCGKSNLYNAFLLMARASSGGFARAVASEGGMSSILWAGVQKRFGARPEQRQLKLGIRADHFNYEIQCGLPLNSSPASGNDPEGLMIAKSQFLFNPQFTKETIWITSERGGKTILMECDGALTSIRSSEGRMISYPQTLYDGESVLSQIREPHLYPEIITLRSAMMGWRFYPHFRTDPDAPLRQPQAGVLTPVLSSEGMDLAAALETIMEIGEAEALREEIDRAFPGARVEIKSEGARFRVAMHMPGLLRPLEAAELSDGTLRYLCLVATVLSPHPPVLLGLKEPETSIHPDLIPSLARLVARAAKHSQLWITTHSGALADAIAEFSSVPPIRLKMVDGETKIE